MAKDKRDKKLGNEIMELTGLFKRNLCSWKDNYTVDEVASNLRGVYTANEMPVYTRGITWYPNTNLNLEWVIVKDSYYPALRNYLNRLRDWEVCFCRCSNCGRMFLATSKHHSLCSAECHKAKNRQNKQEFDERARNNGYDLDYKNTSQRMRNRLHRLQKQKGIPEQRIRDAEAMFADYRKDAVRRKKSIKSDADYKEFWDWLFEQERIFERFCVQQSKQEK